MAKHAKKPGKKPPAEESPQPAATTCDPAKLTREDAAKLLSKAGGQEITAARIAAQVEAGAPTNADGTLHLVHYAAWLASEVP